MSKSTEVGNHKRYPRTVISQFGWIMEIVYIGDSWENMAKNICWVHIKEGRGVPGWHSR